MTPGGAVMVHVVPAHETAGKRVLWPILFPCVLVSAPMSDTEALEAGPVGRVTVIWICSP